MRTGHARCSTAQQEPQNQLDALKRTERKRTFSDKISTRTRTRPEPKKTPKLTYDIKKATPDQKAILTVHELKRLAHNAAD
ncbi:recombinase family protein [Streptomyces sp. Ru73]|uniref:recombinase family protein n=1 Tax=Streptomyces sp. Ru73 TaxID=2080748 RepID=UPI001CA54972